MNFARCSSLLCVSLVTAVLAASCASTHDTADVVPALPGAFQPDGGGPLIDEATACAELSQAESRARVALGCVEVKRSCPGFIRPAGGADCFRYDQASLDGCSDLFDSFSSCEQFEQRPCLATAVSDCDVDSGALTGASGAGGQSGGAAGAGAVGGAGSSG